MQTTSHSFSLTLPLLKSGNNGTFHIALLFCQFTIYSIETSIQFLQFSTSSPHPIFSQINCHFFFMIRRNRHHPIHLYNSFWLCTDNVHCIFQSSNRGDIILFIINLNFDLVLLKILVIKALSFWDMHRCFSELM